MGGPVSVQPVSKDGDGNNTASPRLADAAKPERWATFTSEHKAQLCAGEVGYGSNHKEHKVDKGFCAKEQKANKENTKNTALLPSSLFLLACAAGAPLPITCNLTPTTSRRRRTFPKIGLAVSRKNERSNWWLSRKNERMQGVGSRKNEGMGG